MGISDDAIAFERSILARHADLTAIYETWTKTGAVRVRHAADQASLPALPGDISASALKRAAIDAEIAAVLDEYSAHARPLVGAVDAARWREWVMRMPQRRAGGITLDGLDHCALGAASLREALRTSVGHRPRPAPRCFCEIAPKETQRTQLCDECEDALLHGWVAEERRLLRTVPGYAAEVMRIMNHAEHAQAKVLASRGDYLSSEAWGKRKAAGRRLRRAARVKRAELDELDLDRWHGFIEPLSRASTWNVKQTAQKAQRYGLGTAAIAALGLLVYRETD